MANDEYSTKHLVRFPTASTYLTGVIRYHYHHRLLNLSRFADHRQRDEEVDSSKSNRDNLTDSLRANEVFSS